MTDTFKYEDILIARGFEPYEPTGEWTEVFHDTSTALGHVKPYTKNSFVIALLNSIDVVLNPVLRSGGVNKTDLNPNDIYNLRTRNDFLIGYLTDVTGFKVLTTTNVDEFDAVVDAIAEGTVATLVGIDWMRDFISRWAKDDVDAE